MDEVMGGVSGRAMIGERLTRHLLGSQKAKQSGDGKVQAGFGLYNQST